MRRCFIIAFCFIVLSGNGANAVAQAVEVQDEKSPHSLFRDIEHNDLELEVGLELGYLNGYTLYERGGSFLDPYGVSTVYPSPLSKLEFALDVYMLGLSSTLTYEDRLNVSFEIKKNLDRSSGSMKDSDWGYWYLEYDGEAPLLHDLSPRSLDIYSESQASLDAWVLDAKASYTVLKYPQWSCGAGFGLLYQYLDYEISDTEQWYPSYAYYFGSSAGSDTYRGKILIYEITYIIPYLLAEAGVNVAPGLTLSADIGYSPFALGYDRDHHLIGVSGTGSISETDYTGHALRYGVQGRGEFHGDWMWGLRYEYLKIVGDGESYNYSGDGSAYTGKIDQEVESVQKSIHVTIGYCFR